MVLVGTRPEVIKMAPVYLALREDSRFHTTLLTSGQHTSLLDRALDDFSIKADFQLADIPAGSGLDHITSLVLTGVTKILLDARPDVLLVHGDTTTSMAGALAAFYLGIPVAHVEAGLRTRNLASPFPEEANRQLVARLAKWNFAPTELARANLEEEGVALANMFVTGNTIVDALRLITEKSARPDREQLFPKPVESSSFVLVTLHRRENLMGGMESTLKGIQRFALANPGTVVLFPMHPNPAVRHLAQSLLAQLENVMLLEPMGYKDFIRALMQCEFVVTDSGGIQEEAVTLGKHVLVARDSSERFEGGAQSLMSLIGTAEDDVFSSMTETAASLSSGNPHSTSRSSVFGDGLASSRIRDQLALDLLEPSPPIY
jgi:UDP-N-acetylglucosamine 2-epimerase (non-hydrolysing)